VVQRSLRTLEESMAQPELNECPTAAAMAAELIGEHYRDLREAQIVWALTDKKAPCKPHLLSAAERWFDSQRQAVELGADILCVINGSMWDFLSATGQRIALVDHLLAHIERQVKESDDPDEDGEVTWKIRPHDVEEFQDVLRRRGPWQPVLRDFVALARQLPMPLPQIDATLRAAGVDVNAEPAPDASPSESDGMLYADVRRGIDERRARLDAALSTAGTCGRCGGNLAGSAGAADTLCAVCYKPPADDVAVEAAGHETTARLDTDFKRQVGDFLEERLAGTGVTIERNVAIGRRAD
jgi:hypothetical protein